MTNQKTWFPIISRGIENEPMPERACSHEVDGRITDELIRECARRHCLPGALDIALFAKGVRAAARELVGHAPDHVIRAEVERLRSAANTRNVNKLCKLLQCLSPQTTALLNGRRVLIADFGVKPFANSPEAPAGPIPSNTIEPRSRRHHVDGTQMHRLSLPSPDEIRSPASQVAGFQAIIALTTRGVQIVQGRKRGRGPRSTTRKHRLFAPPAMRPGRPTNDAAWEAAAFMRVAYIIAHEEGREPPKTSNHQFPSGFAQFFKDILWYLGISGDEINAVEAILNYDRRRKQLEKQRPSRPAK